MPAKHSWKASRSWCSSSRGRGALSLLTHSVLVLERALRRHPSAERRREADPGRRDRPRRAQRSVREGRSCSGGRRAGANLNAVTGRTRPGDMGFDIVHFNLHKTFTQPHGRGGPDGGPIAVSTRIAPYVMTPRVRRGEEGGPQDMYWGRPGPIASWRRCCTRRPGRGRS